MSKKLGKVSLISQELKAKLSLQTTETSNKRKGPPVKQPRLKSIGKKRTGRSVKKINQTGTLPQN